jgi:uncharacterized membrane protein YraQ (UPF0718 family)/copper chaperone CopZ
MNKLFEIAIAFWDVLGEMSPYLLLGFLFAGFLYVYIPASFVEKHLGKKGILSTIKASAFGIPLPLCSCGVIPVAASLRRSGASRGATTAFLISTPQTGVDSILVTYSLLGIVFAIFRPVMALIKGILGGWIVDIATSDSDSPGENVVSNTDSNCGCGNSCDTVTEHETESKLVSALKYGFIDLPADIGKALLIGLFISGIISALVPGNYFSDVLGSGIGAMFVMMIIGIPVYVCATASVPVAAALITAGVSPGAALVFLMTGPATNAATIAVIWRTMGKKTAVIYLAVVAVAAIASGLLLDYIFTHSGATASAPMPWMFPFWFKSLCSVIMLGILFYSFVVKSHVKEIPALDEGKERVTIQISGMTCSHCVESVSSAIGKIKGVEDVVVDLKSGKGVITGLELDISAIKRAVEELGYKVDV